MTVVGDVVTRYPQLDRARTDAPPRSGDRKDPGSGRRLEHAADLETDQHDLGRIENAARPTVDENLANLLDEHELAPDDRHQQHGNRVPTARASHWG